jgi:hypothetical protein
LDWGGLMDNTAWKLASIRRGTNDADEWPNTTVIWLLDHIDTLTAKLAEAERHTLRAHVIGLGGFLPKPRKPNPSPSPVEESQ